MKYFSSKVVYNGIKFDSKTERDRYIQLQTELNHGLIQNLEMQKEFELLPKQTRIVRIQQKTKIKEVERVDEQAVKYHCDFFYYDLRFNKYIIEEVKSKMTAKVRDYPLRRKLIKLMVKRMNAEQGREMYLFREIIK